MSQPSIEIRGVTKTFPAPGGSAVPAVRGVDLTVETGEVVSVLGPNGAGKTTTLDLLLGLSSPSTGTVRVLGTEPRRAVAAGRVGAVLQTGGLLGDLRVEETVRIIAALHPRHVPVGEVIERADLARIARRPVAACSGGERQRLRFALALLPDPDLLVLDEPTAGMDVNAREDFWAAMHREAEEGRTIVFATHYLAEADSFAARIIIMADGRIVADGPTREIRELTGHTVVTFRRSGVDLGGLRSFPGTVGVTDGERVSVTTTRPDELARWLLTRTAAEGLEIAPAGLDEVFADLTRRPDPAAGRVPAEADGARR